MAITLSQTDFDRLRILLSQSSNWGNVRDRVSFMTDVFAGSPRKQDILGQLDLDGAPGTVASRVIQRLMVFGQDELGREALGVLINRLLSEIGGGDDADFLRGLLERYSFTTSPIATKQVGRWKGSESNTSVAEKIIGENTLRNIAVLEIALDAARAVVRVNTDGELGSGFMISNDLLITNHHVIPDETTAGKSTFQFNYQLDRKGTAMEARTAHTLPGGLFITSPMQDYNASKEALDYTIVQLQDAPPVFAPLTLKGLPIKRDGRVTIIQHPGGDYKKISFQNNFVEYIDTFVVQYTTSTEPGSSGSPVFNDDFAVVAIHHAGGDLSEPATQRRYYRNEGICISAILEDVQARAPQIYERLKQ